MRFTLPLIAALAFAAPVAANEFCAEMGALAQSQAEARDAGVTRSMARAINAKATDAGIGDLSESISDLVWASDMEPDTLAVVVTAACLQAQE